VKTNFCLSFVLSLSLALAAACGDDDDSDTGGVGDLPAGTVLVVGGDSMANGIFSLVDTASLAVTTNALDGVVDSDPVLRVFGDTAYVINRSTANVSIIDLETLTLVDQVSTGNANNPQDIVEFDGKLYVSTFEAPGVVVFDLADLTAPPATIDLGALDPTDDAANANSIRVVGDRLFVTIERLDANFAPQGNGLVAIVDPSTDTLESSFELSTPNPFGLLQETPADSGFGGDLVIGTIDFADGSGCIQRIAADGTASCIVDNATLEGYVNGLAYDPGSGELLIAVTNADFSGARLHAVSADGSVSVAITPAEQFPQDVEVCSTGEIVVVERPFGDAAKGLRIYGPDDVELTTSILDIGLPPAAIGGVVCL